VYFYAADGRRDFLADSTTVLKTGITVQGKHEILLNIEPIATLSVDRMLVFIVYKIEGEVKIAVRLLRTRRLLRIISTRRAAPAGLSHSRA
jgi:hypothetical protein